MPAERDRPENHHKEMGKGMLPLETWQKYRENGEYLRSAEITRWSGKPAQQMEAAQDTERRRK